MAEQNRWRAREGETFYFIKITHQRIFITSTWEECDDAICQILYDMGNYFRTKEEAQTAADEMQKVLLRRAGELHDFTWAYEQMKQGKKVRRPDWEKGEYMFLYIDALKCDTFKKEFFFKFLPRGGEDGKGGAYQQCICISDFEATDWEIYEEPTE